MLLARAEQPLCLAGEIAEKRRREDARKGKQEKIREHVTAYENYCVLMPNCLRCTLSRYGQSLDTRNPLVMP